jgi:glycerol-3-phosphate dehydrogenase (NAD(P)+)
MPRRIVVLGAGGWGTALAVVAARAGHRVTLWGRRPEHVEELRRSRRNEAYLAGITIPGEIAFASGADGALDEADGFISVIPTQHLRATLTPVAERIGGERPVLSCSKGIETGSLSRPSEILRETLGRAPVTVLSGPSHAEEVARGLPATLVAASRDEEHAVAWQKLLTGEAFRLYTSNDPLGVELGGALKNVIAIAAGLCDGLKLGDNAKAALLSRGIVEIGRLGAAVGARKQTFFGLSGIGDLLTTCYSPHGRNLRVGRELGAGRKLPEILASMKQVAEGVWTCRAARELGRKHDVPMPITEEVFAVVHQDRPAIEGLRSLMRRQPKSESEDLR